MEKCGGFYFDIHEKSRAGVIQQHTADVDLNTKIFKKLLSHQQTDLRSFPTNYYEDAITSPVESFQAFSPTDRCNPSSMLYLSSSSVHHTPPHSRSPSPDSIFQFDPATHRHPLSPILPPPPCINEGHSAQDPFDSPIATTPMQPGNRATALSPIGQSSSPLLSSSLPMTEYFSSLPATNGSKAKNFSPITPPPSHSGLSTADGCSSPASLSSNSSRGSSNLSSLESVPTLFQDPRWGPGQLSSPTVPEAIGSERKAIMRSDSGSTDPTYTWSGQLPPRVYKNPVYSIKVFLGGVPWDITEAGLQQAFRQFGTVKVEWPGKEGKQNRHPPKGYVYLLFENERSIKSLLTNCTHDYSNGGDWYYKISSRRMRSKEVQVIPWVLSDSNHAKNVTQKLDSNKTVFVGGLHGMINAEALAMIMNDLFEGVIYAGIDTDKHKYPIGSGRVTFNNSRSYSKAVQAAFIEIRTPKFTKKVQIDPYLEDAMCQTCNNNPGPFFCRDPGCFRYFCRSCWNWHHSIEGLKHHRPMSRHSKNPTGSSSSGSSSF